ncbi:MAG TPA: polyprenyl synthetase family protein [Chryseolinea sp.]|nr:polyprenyl synthetase family protein [Chryseolinea sp.]
MASPAQQYLTWIDQHIARERYGKTPASLYEPIQYIMSLGGKRLRPILTLFAYGLFRDDVKSIIKYAVAVEAFHNFTLMHDDIMDKAPLRRGKITVHKKWNVNTAILSGDVMLVKVYDMFLTVESQNLARIILAFNKCAASVCEGQQWDMEFEKEKYVSEANYINMIRLKTAALIGFSLELGGILAGASDKDCKALREFGTNIGIGFQLKDDLLDAYADPKKFGKQVGGDIIANKKTFLLIKALERSKGKQKIALEQWLSRRKFNKKEKVGAVKTLYDSLDLSLLAEKKINFYFTKGFNNLEALSCGPEKTENLNSFTKALIKRQS